MRSFESMTYGKWILAGEHSVLRGSSALVFPVYESYLKFSFEAGESPFRVSFSGKHGEELRFIFWNVVEQALQTVDRSRSELRGSMTIENNLAIGAGLGASAAICVGIGRWWMALGWIDESELYSFAKGLEDLFHGESSGVDIAASLVGQGLKFRREEEWAPLEVTWQPNWYISFCGQKGSTSECVGQVKALLDERPEYGQSIDREMESAVAQLESALKDESSEALNLLIEGVNRARGCFEKWGLMSPALIEHCKVLKEKGAQAYKPTGSGGGGFVLSVWREEPPEELKDRLISLNRPVTEYIKPN